MCMYNHALNNKHILMKMQATNESECTAPCKTFLGPGEQSLVAYTSCTSHTVLQTVCGMDNLDASDPAHLAFLWQTQCYCQTELKYHSIYCTSLIKSNKINQLVRNLK